jgi:hypothetical protein
VYVESLRKDLSMNNIASNPSSMSQSETRKGSNKSSGGSIQRWERSQSRDDQNVDCRDNKPLWRNCSLSKSRSRSRDTFNSGSSHGNENKVRGYMAGGVNRFQEAPEFIS